MSLGSSRTAGWAEARRVLCIRLDAMGDVLMTGPALAALKAAGPANRHVTLLTSQSGSTAARLMPYIDDIIVAEVPWMKSARVDDHAANLAQLAATLTARNFDAAVIMTVYSQSALPAAMLCLMADIPLRLAHCRENPYHLLTDWIPDPEPHLQVRHEVRRQLDLVEAACGEVPDAPIKIHVARPAYSKIDKLLRGLHTPWILMHPGATAPSRRYSPASFAEVARLLHEQTGCHLLFTGSLDEQPLIQAIQQESGVPSTSLAGLLDLAEMAALVKRAPILICNNTGPAHIAAATQTPVVCLYALTNPQHTPWMTPRRVLFHEVPCKYCYKSICPQGHHQCLELIQPSMVVAAALELLEEVSSTATDHSLGKSKPSSEPQLPSLSLPLPVLTKPALCLP